LKYIILIMKMIRLVPSQQSWIPFKHFLSFVHNFLEISTFKQIIILLIDFQLLIKLKIAFIFGFFWKIQGDHFVANSTKFNYISEFEFIIILLNVCIFIGNMKFLYYIFIFFKNIIWWIWWRIIRIFLYLNNIINLISILIKVIIC
jgi:hypothetical protein